MSAIQTLPFALDEHPVDGTSNYDDQLGRTYINNQDGPGTYRLVKWTGAAQVAGALAGAPIAASALTLPFEADVVGASTANPNFVGIVHPSLTGPVAVGDYLLVLVDGQGYGLDNAVPLTVGQLADALVGAAPLGPAGGVTMIVREAVAVAGLKYPGMVKVEFVVKKVQVAA